ncbi:MAG: carboxypeptidase-like regulatory domain-containing protein, partial [Chitinophagaceae bacterium]
MRKIASLLTVLMFVCALAFGQNRTVTGTVKDDRGEVIPFATIAEVGTNNAAQADAKGNFAITVKGGARLIATAAGFQSVTLSANGSTQNFSLKRTEGQLQEVVVTTALGIRKQPRELGYSVAKISNKELTQATPVNVQNGLTGKVSGLNVATTNNGVFGDTRITLRGIRSLTGNNQPLLVLDGSPVPLSQLNRLNP